MPILSIVLAISRRSPWPNSGPSFFCPSRRPRVGIYRLAKAVPSRLLQEPRTARARRQQQSNPTQTMSTISKSTFHLTQPAQSQAFRPADLEFNFHVRPNKPANHRDLSFLFHPSRQHPNLPTAPLSCLRLIAVWPFFSVMRLPEKRDSDG